MPPPYPTGTVTFLFTDIEGSTALAQQNPAEMPALLAWHHELLRQSIAAQAGYLFEIIGDAFSAAFYTAGEALQAAIQAQCLLNSPDAPFSGLRVRMGIHTGPAQPGRTPTDSAGYSGYLTLARAQRLLSTAYGGQVLLSDTTADLVQYDLPSGAELLDLGEHRLKGLQHPEHLWQVIAADLPRDFPPVQSLNYIPSNLPLQLSSFIGREGELAETKRLLETTRLLTLTGPGGTGKTRLSLQLAGDVMEAFPGGVWLVELAPLSDPALVPQAAAAALGVHELFGRSLLEGLIDYLRAKSLLLLLDNCEHLIDACAGLVTTLLSACPKLKILSTCREALGVTGETIYRLPSFSLPDRHSTTADALLKSEAVRLFVERAQEAQPHFSPTESNLNAIAQICQRLDGIPLALELAAARLKLFSVEQIAARLDDRFRLLTGGSRSALPRQQTLRALIDWSYDLLPPSERQALNRLSVFAGGWTFEAALAVLGPEALDALSHLVDKSLVVVEESPAEEENRYRLLETIRQYARDKLLESGESQTVRDLHLATYLDQVLEAEPWLQSLEILRWLDRLEVEQDNLRSALEWGLERDPESALEMAANLIEFWRNRGDVTEGRRWVSESLRRYETLAPGEGEARRQHLALRARGLFTAGNLAYMVGELQISREFLEESADLARETGELRTLVNTLEILGFTLGWLGDNSALDALIEEGLEISRQTKDKRDIAAIRIVQADHAARIHGDFNAARDFAKEALHLYRDELRNPFLAAISVMDLGLMAVLQENYPEALAQFEQAEALFHQMGNKRMANGMKSEQAHVLRQQSLYEDAIVLYRQTILAWQELGARPPVAHQLECFAFIAIAQAQTQNAALLQRAQLLQRAAVLLGAAEALRETTESPMRPNERSEYDQQVSALRQKMDPGVYAEAWVQGRSLNMDEAVAFALAK